MATHFARGILKDGHLLSVRLSSTSHNIARQLPAHRRTRYLASRALLAELLFMLYGISELPEIETQEEGKPYFKDSHLPDFSIAYAGNIVGVALTTEGQCGLDMELLRTLRNTPQATMMESSQLSFRKSPTSPSIALPSRTRTSAVIASFGTKVRVCSLTEVAA